jgi:hypothetical protein
MAVLNVFAKDSSGNPVPNQLVTINTFPVADWNAFGLPINPNPRRTGPDGGVNFYTGGPLHTPVMVQASCQNGTTEPMRFDGTEDVSIALEVVPFV